MSGPPRRPRRRPRPNRHPEGKDLSAYLDGALAPRKTLGLEAHVAGCAGCREKLRELRAAKSALADLAPADPQPGWLRHVEELIAGGATPRRTQLAPQRLHRGAVATGLAAAALGAGVWLAPPPEAPVSFQDQIRRHLVQMGEPLSDQTSYVVEARYP